MYFGQEYAAYCMRLGSDEYIFGWDGGRNTRGMPVGNLWYVYQREFTIT